jgi:hypothetical protein
MALPAAVTSIAPRVCAQVAGAIAGESGARRVPVARPGADQEVLTLKQWDKQYF